MPFTGCSACPLAHCFRCCCTQNLELNRTGTARNRAERGLWVQAFKNKPLRNASPNAVKPHVKLKTTREIKKVYLKVCKTALRPTFPRHYDMVTHFLLLEYKKVTVLQLPKPTHTIRDQTLYLPTPRKQVGQSQPDP